MILRYSVVLRAILIVTCLLSSAEAAKKKKRPPASDIAISPEFYDMCNGYRPLPHKGGTKKKLQWLVEASGAKTLLLKSSPQHSAACWVLHRDRKRSSKKQALIQRYTLAVLHFATTHSNTTAWDWGMADRYDPRMPEMTFSTKAKDQKKMNKPHNWLSEKQDECSWYGVTCNWRSHIVQLELGFLKLDGLVPSELSLLAELKELDLHGNDLQGVLPHKILVGLEQLERLKLYMNGFFGSLHHEIVALKSLKELSMFGNYMSSPIPTELGSLRNLEAIDLYANNLSGRIPSELGRLKNLVYLDLHDK
jgi:hypothetical protein